MPERGVVPGPPPPVVGQLPFLTTGALNDQGGAAVPGADAIPVSVWPATRARIEAVGKQFDHEGEAALAFADELAVANRRLVVDGVSYTVIEAAPMDLVPHVALLLRHVKPAGQGG